ncbi:hypothetical protein BT96DRAFT_995313 [Gymnopus androsaceus JB14]|uniref:Uncharacterized protein n=1 Tax=Gymnopus androsaceus JB14 TaxID=1447944 RepID=A0A6A4HH48_9AGAR|nr:hypothetical protein BT96DRAFT_995313 [Gymnopus androsaceus JB14]
MTKENLLKNRKKRENGQSSSIFTLPSSVDELPASVLKLHTKNTSRLPIATTFLHLQWAPREICIIDLMLITVMMIQFPSNFTSLADDIMWLDLRDSDLTYTTEGEKRKEGVVEKELTDELESQIAPLKQSSSLLSPKIQCGFLTVQALLDYTDLESRSVTSGAPLSFQRDKMGAFVWNDRDARLLHHAGLPVFFIRPWIGFDRQIVEAFILLQQPRLPQVQMAPADPPYHTIMMGQAGSDSKFSAIRWASIQCFDIVSPFQNLHVPGAYTSSFELGKGRIMAPASSPPSHLQLQPSSSQTHGSKHSKNLFRHSQQMSRSAKARKPDMNPPKVQRDTFADLPKDDPLVPPAITAWKDVNKTIDQNGVLPGKRLLAVPDPGLFFGLQHQNRQSPYLFMWQHFRDAWITALEGGRSPLTVELWRKILAYAYLQPIEPGQVVSPKMQATLDAKKIVEDVILAYSSHMLLMPAPSTATFDPSTARQLIRELCMVNFRSELLYVDQVLDTSKPVPQRNLTMAELDAARAQHQRDRITLMNGIFLYHALVPPPNDDFGIAAVDWSDCYNSLKHFWTLLNTWPLSKPAMWRRGMDMDLSHKQFAMREGAQWERMLAEYYVRSVFSVLKHAPSLPRRLVLAP